MRYLYFIFLLTLMSCGVTKNTYMCGDRECIDKKEFKEYFAENLIMEIKKERKKENLKIDLVSINTNEINEDKSKKTSKKQNYRTQKKKKKKKIKEEKKKHKKKKKKKKKEKKKKTNKNNKK